MDGSEIDDRVAALGNLSPGEGVKELYRQLLEVRALLEACKDPWSNSFYAVQRFYAADDESTINDAVRDVMKAAG